MKARKAILPVILLKPEKHFTLGQFVTVVSDYSGFNGRQGFVSGKVKNLYKVKITNCSIAGEYMFFATELTA